jgi:hypothetical protein
MPDTFFQTREQYLTAAVKLISPMLTRAGADVPPVRVSVGWPGGRRARASVIGQCWAPTAADDGVQQVYVSPVLSEPVDVLAVLAHELCHAADRCEHGHRGPFGRYARAIGLEGPLPATVPGEELRATLADISRQLGAYPHAALRSTAASAHPKQSTRMIKASCPTTGYIARTTRRWIDAYGAPVCPCCNKPMTIEGN